MSEQEEPECANPLFLAWVGEWYDEACKRNSKTQYTLKKAYNSLQRYPLRIQNAQETVQLQGIGQGIADRLAKRLSAWRKENNITEPSEAPAGSEQAREPLRSRNNSANNNGGAGRLYIPRYRSGAFALMIGLLKVFCLYGPDYFVPKAELIRMCEQYTDTPFHVAGSSARGGGRGRGHGGSGAGAGFAHTAWSGMKTLETKGLAERQGGV
ncbi:Crossover junction endonuclease mus81, partial [Coemansia sp. RSA 2599]